MPRRSHWANCRASILSFRFSPLWRGNCRGSQVGGVGPQQVGEPGGMDAFFESDTQRPLQAPEEAQDRRGFGGHRRLHDQFSLVVNHSSANGRRMQVHTDILDAVHRVLLCAVSLVASTTKPTIPSKGRPFIMRTDLALFL